ncbi:short-chain dehydrogenase, partial [Burkholderia pseudomallei]
AQSAAGAVRAVRVHLSAIVAGGLLCPLLLDRVTDVDAVTLQRPGHVAAAVRVVLTQLPGTVIPEVMVLPVKETSWP